MRGLRVDSGRFKRDFEELSGIGGTGDGGVHRPALGESHLKARRWFRERIRADGLEFLQDGAGNHSARLSCGNTGARTLLLGSHLDSVDHGGRFDGALGVLAAYEVVRTVRDAGVELAVNLEAIDFTDEEGALIGLLGSRALVGLLSARELEAPRGGKDRLSDGLRRAGLTASGALDSARDPSTLAGFLELHIEQGPRLVRENREVGIVTAIVGIGSAELVLTGRADHAGTTPLDARRDAGLGAAELITRATEQVRADLPDCVVNFGRVRFLPGSYNIVPETAELAMEYRAPTTERMVVLESALLDVARECSHERGLELEVRSQPSILPAPCAAECRQAFADAADLLGLSHLSMASGAGHDAMALASVCPAGMIFIPSTGGSHSPREFAKWEDCLNGANVLLLATLGFAAGARP